MYEIQLEHTFDTGHRIVGHEGKCANLHGHTYRVELTAVSLQLVEPGFVVDFGHLKKAIDGWDHKLLLWDKDPFFQEFRGIIPNVMEEYGIVNVPFNPTAENMVKGMAEALYKRFNLYSLQVSLWETPKANASWLILPGSGV